MPSKEERQARFERRKAKADGRLSKQGFVGGNPRYNGKQGWGQGDPAKSRRAS